MAHALTQPVTFLPYGRQTIEQDDIDAVVRVLRSDWLTCGPTIVEFERALTEYTGTNEAVACATGTAALHLAMLAIGVGEGDVVVTSANTFLASANCARYCGAEVQFADVDPATGLLDPNSLEQILRNDPDHKIKAVIPVHFAGQPVDLSIIHQMVQSHGAAVVDDACHALGAEYSHEGVNARIGNSPYSDMTCFSFHPVKHVAMGEGGAVLTNDSKLADQLRLFRNHGMQKDRLKLEELAFDSEGELNPWYYEMQQLGYNFRITDLQAALGISQLTKLGRSVARRNEIARQYQRLLAESFDSGVQPLRQQPQRKNAYHLFTVLINFEQFGTTRARVMKALRDLGVGTQVHYIPVPAQPYYRERYGYEAGRYAGTEEYYAKALSVPMYPALTDQNVEYVVAMLKHVLESGV